MTHGPKRSSPIGDHAEKRAIPNHPDQNALIDWGTFGPKDRRIEQLVWELAQDYGLRLVEIEAKILKSLYDYKEELAEARQGQSSSGASSDPHLER